MLAHKFIGGSIAGGSNLFKKTDGPDRVRTRLAADPTNLAVQYARTDIRKFSFGLRVVEPWNKLAPDTRSCIQKGQFKSKIRAKHKASQ
jgi:hypothetical protein